MDKKTHTTKQSSRRAPIQKVIFKTLARKKAISLDLLKKEVGDIINYPHSDTNNSDYAISRSMKNLISDGLVERFQSEAQPYFRLSALGKKKLNSNALVDDTALISNNWDGYWRIIIIDLPEERKNEREALRYLLKKAGFVCLKNSVWISMYPYENLFINIKKDLGLTSEMMIIVTDRIDEETRKEFFNSIKN
jgi:DNA-binding transcriptional regulator PaaX